MLFLLALLSLCFCLVILKIGCSTGSAREKHWYHDMRLCFMSDFNFGVGEIGVFGGGDGAEEAELPVLLRILLTDIFFCSLATGEVDCASKGAVASVGLVDLFDSFMWRGLVLPLLVRCAIPSFVHSAPRERTGIGGGLRDEDSARARDLV
jgi:hypothetical protein